VKVDGKEQTISGETFETLRARILAGDIAPGSKVRTQELSQRMGVSLGAVREALSQLIAEGLVLVEAHRGYTVTPLSIEDLLDLTRVRTEAEVLCLTWSMQSGQLEWESEVIAASHRLAKTFRAADRAAVSPAWIAAHNAYHTALASACGSPRLLLIRKQLYELSERYNMMESAMTRNRDSDDEHRRITEAAIERNVPVATQLLSTHIERTTENIVKMMRKKVAEGARAANPRSQRRKASPPIGPQPKRGSSAR
jgi:GntR family transcriptional regulator, carbon starvation induced regulator